MPTSSNIAQCPIAHDIEFNWYQKTSVHDEFRIEVCSGVHRRKPGGPLPGALCPGPFARVAICPGRKLPKGPFPQQERYP